MQLLAIFGYVFLGDLISFVITRFDFMLRPICSTMDPIWEASISFVPWSPVNNSQNKVKENPRNLLWKFIQLVPIQQAMFTTYWIPPNWMAGPPR